MKGVEVEYTFLPTDNLRFMGSIAYMDAEDAFTVFVLAVNDLRQQISDVTSEIAALQQEFAQGFITETDYQREITAYLDVTYPEPPEAGHPFYRLPNCVLTPHVAGSVGREVHRMSDYCLRELKHWIAGEPLESSLQLDALEDRA